MSVEWSGTALDQLADIYVAAAAPDRDGIEQCVQRINSRLATDPRFLGESRGSNRRAWFHHPLVVIFRQKPGGGVIVSHVARLRPRRAGQNGND